MAQIKKLEWLEWQWYVALTVIAVLGVILIAFNPLFPKPVQDLCKNVKSDRWAILVGIYLISIFVSHLVIFIASRLMHRLLDLSQEDTRADLWSPALVGLCESIMYPTVLLIDKAEFIGVWLAVKVAGQWVRWGSESPSNLSKSETREMLNEGRRRFNRFLVGNALSIMAGAATWVAIKIWALS